MRYQLKDLTPDTCEVYGDRKFHRYELGGRLILKIWKGKQSRPYSHYHYGNEASREHAVAQAKAAYDRDVQYREEQKQYAAKASQEGSELFQIGTLLSYSWGYDQTNIQFFQVIERTAKTCTVMEISGSTVRDSQYGDTWKTRPVKDSFLKNAKPMVKRIQGKTLRMDHGSLTITHELEKHMASTGH